MAVFIVLPFPKSMGTTLLLCGGMVLLVALLSRKWWIWTSLILLGLLSIGVLWYQNGLTLRREWRAVLDFFTWWVNKFPRSSSWWVEGGPLLVQVLLTAGVVLLVFLMIRRAYSFLMTAVAVTAVFITLYVLNYKDLVIPLCITLVGLSMLLPRSVHKSMLKKNRLILAPARSYMQFLALPVGVLAVMLALFLTPQDARQFQSPFLYQQSMEIKQYFSNIFTTKRDSFNLEGTGYQPAGGRMGGSINLNQDPVMTVKTNYPSAVRGSVMDQYTGYSWEDSRKDGTHPFREDTVDSDDFQAAFGTDRFNHTGRQVLNQITTNITAEITMLQDTVSTLFVPGRPQSILVGQDAYYDMQSEMFVKRPLSQGESYTVVSRFFNRDLENFASRILQLERINQNQTDLDYDRIVERYTQLPDDVPQEVWDMARMVTAGADTDYQKAALLERWINENTAYSLDVPMPPEDQDFVAHFLETREGYCTYTASAMAVMARTLGIPSRYVVGFSVGSAEMTEPDIFTVRNAQAHAWAEIYLKGIGWIPFDPTIRYEYSLNFFDENEAEDPNGLGNVSSDLSGASSRDPSWDTSTTPMDNQAQNRTIDPEIIRSVLVVLGAILLLAAVTAWRIWRRNHRYQLDRLRQKGKPNDKIAFFYGKDIARQLKHLDLFIEPGETWLQFGRRADEKLKLSGDTVSDWMQVLTEWKYGEQPIDDSRLQTAQAVHTHLEQCLKSRLNPVSYFVIRILLE
nr:transglutaminaseTgpA domain-containing protein [uncultured Solibaculum sp.]